MTDYERQRESFPVIGTPWSIPFDVVQAHNKQCLKNHSQSAQRLKERGGLSWEELHAVLQDMPYQQFVNTPENKRIVRRGVLQLIENFEKNKEKQNDKI